jgi:hypothetical protein
LLLHYLSLSSPRFSILFGHITTPNPNPNPNPNIFKKPFFY